jgi:Bacterial PH domain
MARIQTRDDGVATIAGAQAELTPGEKLTWADRPRLSAIARRELPRGLMGIPFTAFAVFWTFAASGGLSKNQAHAPDFFMLWGFMFIGIGLFILCSPLWSIWKARSTIYAITGERLMIIEGWNTRRVTSYARSDIQEIERVERRDGSGDVVFRREAPTTRRYTISFSSMRGMGNPIGFFGVSDVRRVETSIRQFAGAAGKSWPGQT